jgi:rSAM/selenodomain-associated transferase 1
MNNQDAVLCVFTKTPIAGNVKNRLIPSLGEEKACQLYQSLLTRTLETACSSGFTEIRLYCTPTTEHPFLQTCAKNYAVQLFLQKGDDLGARMDRALTDGLKEFSCAVVIGCDCPWLTLDDLEQAYRSLTKDKGVVLGPACDGGYYLLGLSSPHPMLFENMSWGDSSVLNETRRRLSKAGVSWSELTEHPDLDRPEDLIAYNQLVNS